MSDYYSTRGDFTVRDYKGGVDILSSFNLPITPLHFKSKSLSYIGERTNIVWDFGDGTLSQDSAPSHYYKAPGIYRVRLTYYDCTNNGVIGTVFKDIQILDFIKDTFSINVGTEILSSSSGGLSTPITITQTLPYTITANTINYKVSGSHTPWYFNQEYKHNHLLPHHCLYSKETINNIEYLNPIRTLSVAADSIYGTVVDNDIIVSPTSISTDSILIGVSGTREVFYRDDSLLGDFAIAFNRNIAGGSNTISTTITGTVYENQDVDHLSITSTGIDGDSCPTNTFNIDSIKIENTRIPFVVKVKDSFNNTVKNFSTPISASNISILKNGVEITGYSVSSLQHTITGVYGERCAFRGYVVFDSITTPITGVQLYAQINATNTNSTNFGIITGVSTPFTVYPKNYYRLVKHNEDYDMGGTLRSLATSEPLVSNDTLFNKLFGVIFGDHNIDINGLGKKVYERIANFGDNITNIDTAEIPQLVSIGKMLDIDISVFDGNLISYPTEIKRLINLISINKHKLIGERNKFNRDFDNNNEPGLGEFGLNLGPEIDINTFEVNPLNDKYVVAYEKFSQTYTLLNTMQPLNGLIASTIPIILESEDAPITTQDDIEVLTDGTYYIKDYNNTWGWPLVLPQDYNAGDISRYYIFYEFKESLSTDYIGGVIDFNKTTISPTSTYKELYDVDGIYRYLLLNTLYLSLSLTK